MADALLVAGPLGLAADPAHPELLAGDGFLAAAAAAALSPVQLWARAGTAVGHRQREALSRRRVDIAGLGEEGETLRLPGLLSAPVLPEIEPVDASQLGAVLLIGLPPTECRRARAVVAALPGAESRPLLVAPPADVTGDHLRELAAVATVLVLGTGLAQRALGEDDPVRCGEALVAAGATTVLLGQGPFGGIARYKGKGVTWPALPRPAGDQPPGMARAIFAGVVAAEVAHLGRVDYRHLKRFLATASAVASQAGRSADPRPLMGLDRNAYQDLFLRLRRNAKY